ncbi:hypothetical protein LIER_25446 [Lithospermum erythrorhizon]|uniref:PHD-type domain-containing protein n=1 Tax=Lithospermum erythrorhizon TaxID=34254 RepID=A0AAV3R940_LITER
MEEIEGEVCVEVMSDGSMEVDDLLRVDSKREYQLIVDATETEPCAKRQATESCDKIAEVADCLKSREGEVANDCVGEQDNAKVGDEELALVAKKQADDGLIDVEVHSYINKQIKESSNDDMLSEVMNPNLSLSPKDITSRLQTCNDHVVEPLENNVVVSGEITSICSGNSVEEESLSEGDNLSSNVAGELPKSCVVLEIPEHCSTTGIRKITLKFTKRKEDYDTVVQPVTDVVPSERNSKASSLTAGKKVMADNWMSNVKKLISTRILEGARVKYIPNGQGQELSGVIKDCGYLCGCPLCNYSRVVSAYEFELHAGVKTRHPNNHIYLENGKPIYDIIKELKTTPLSKLDEAIRSVAGSSINEDYYQIWQATLHQRNEVATADHYYMPHGVFRSVSSTMMEGYGSPTSYQYINHSPHFQNFYMETPEKKRSIKRPNCISGFAAEHKKSADGSSKKRDNDLHRLLFMSNGLPDGTDVAYYSKGKKLLGGYKQGNGIVCNCCQTEISPSSFEAHAGLAAKRQPYRHIYASNGLTLHDIALMLASGQNIASTHSDDMCTVCGDRGELILCQGCPRAFHLACLGFHSLPANDWRCQNCKDSGPPGRGVSGDVRPIVVRMKRVVKEPEYEPGGCVVCRSQDFSAAKFDDRTVIICDQCEKEYHVGCLRDQGMCDLKQLPKDKWFCCQACYKIYEQLQSHVSVGPDLISESILDRICLKQGGLSYKLSDDIHWQILRGKSRFSEHQSLLSKAAAIFRDCFDPIVAASGRDLIPVMVYGRNISGQEFGGMYCVVLTVKSVLVSACLLRIFGEEVAELPLVATSRENQGKGYFQALFKCIEELLLSMNVKSLVLPAAEEAESIWTKKFGFRRISNERMVRYRNFQLTVFKGTSMLEKEVHPLAV